MKELSIEEKARRYDEAIERARKLKNGEPINVPDGTLIPVAIFPELAETDDERIRKALIRYFTLSDEHAYNEACGVSYRDIVAWLEKQKACDEIKDKCGELNSVTSKPIEFGPCEYWSDEETRLKLLFFIQTVGAAKLPLTSVNRYVDWIEKQGKKTVAIENFDTEFEKQVSCLIASSMNKEHEYTEAFVKWASEALLNYAKHELEKQDEQNFYASETMNEKKDFDNGFTRMMEKDKKPAEWTEKDDSHIYSITEKLKGKFEKSTVITKFSLEEDLSWLKLLKDRVQSQNGYKAYKRIKPITKV